MKKLYMKAWQILSNTSLPEKHFENDYCRYTQDNESIYFLFPGTNDLKDWCDNLDTKGKAGGGKFHNGFVESAERFVSFVHTKIKEYPSLTPHLYGYSKGGAIALHLAFTLSQQINVNCVTFGQPRLFRRRDFVLNRRLNYTRVYFKHDPVTYLPPESRFIHYPTANEIELPSEWWHKLPFIWAKVLVHTKGYDRRLA